MSEPQLPRRPISPWPVGAGILGTFVALAVFLNDGTLAVEVMAAGALLIGLLLMRKKRAGHGQDSRGGESVPQQKESGQSRAAASFADLADLPAVLTVDEVASYLRTDVFVIITELEAGRMPGNKLGPDWRIRRQALDVWLDGAYQVSAAGPASRQASPSR